MSVHSFVHMRITIQNLLVNYTRNRIKFTSSYRSSNKCVLMSLSTRIVQIITMPSCPVLRTNSRHLEIALWPDSFNFNWMKNKSHSLVQLDTTSQVWKPDSVPRSLTKSVHFLIACFLSSSVENKWPLSSSFSSLIDVFLAETSCVLDKTQNTNNII